MRQFDQNKTIQSNQNETIWSRQIDWDVLIEMIQFRPFDSDDSSETIERIDGDDTIETIQLRQFDQNNHLKRRTFDQIVTLKQDDLIRFDQNYLIETSRLR